MRFQAFAAPLGLSLALALTACGGGGSDTPAPSPVPAGIQTHPASTAANAGQPVTFSVTAQGSGLSYQWQRDGTDVAGATSSTFTLTPTLADDGSRWTVIVKSASGTLASSAATLTVNPPKGISVLAGMHGGEGNADGPVGRFQEPGAITYGDGSLYVAHFGARLRRLVAGTNGEMAVTTRWKGADPYASHVGIAADASGNLYGIRQNRVYRIGADGVETLLAGSGQEATVDGTGAQASFSNPVAIAVDASGLIYVAEHYKIRTVTAAGAVSTHAAATRALFDVTGELYGQPIGVTVPATGLAFDSAGNLVIGVAGSKARKVTPAGVRIDSNLTAGESIAADRQGNLYGFEKCTLYKADAAGSVTVLAGADARRGAADGPGAQASFGNSALCKGQLATDPNGNVYVTDALNNTVRKVAPDGAVSTVAGKAASGGFVDGTDSAARFQDFSGLTFDGKGNFYLVQSNKVRKVTRSGVVTTLNLPEKDANQQPIEYFTGGMAFQGSVIGVANRVVYVVEENGSMRALAGSPNAPRRTNGTGTQAGFDDVCGVTRDGNGNLYVLDCYEVRTDPGQAFPIGFENHIRKITPAGVVTTVLATQQDPGTAQPWSIVADRQGNVYASTNNSSVIKIAADGSGSTTIPVDLQYYSFPAVDPAGNLYLGYAMTAPAVVEKISPSGQVQVVAGRRDMFGLITGQLPGSLHALFGMTIDDRGTIYVLTENSIVSIVQ